jgi:lysozyme
MIAPRHIASLAAGVAILATPVVLHFEGWRLNAYKDPIGIVTDCAGHTKTAEMGGRNTHAECARKLRIDMADHWEGIAACAPLSTLSDEEQAAYLSFAFNVGVGNFCGSALNKKLTAGDRAGACAELSRWVNAGGKPLPGLIERRRAERELCELGLG